jgi:hypothetical protein
MKKHNYYLLTGEIRYLLSVLLLVLIFLFTGREAQAQIYEPEGLNMPGAWNNWTNPPVNNLALASSTQVVGGKITKITTGTPRYQTILKVAAAGGDIVPGTYTWLFTSGPETSAFQNKWAGVTVVPDSLQLYTKEGTTDNSVTLDDNRYYTVNWEDVGYVNCRAIFMKTWFEPVKIDTVYVPTGVIANTPANIEIWANAAITPEEQVYVRYSTDGWQTSALSLAAKAGMMANATIPGQPAGTIVSYYALTTTRLNLTTDVDLYTINFKNNNGANYSYTVGTPPPVITFANLQWPESGEIMPFNVFEVFGQAYIEGITGQSTPAPGLMAWVGYHTENTDPSSWSNWVDAGFNGPSGNNDEFKANIGSLMANTGIYYYALRYKYNNDLYVYGGYSATGGGFWNGTTNVSGKLDVAVGIEELHRAGIRMWPNPFTDEFRLELSEASTICISDLQGRIVLQKKFGPGNHIVNVSSLIPGNYHFIINKREQTLVAPVIKQRK